MQTLTNRLSPAGQKHLKRYAILAIVLSLAILVACAANEISDPIPCPAYPELLPIDPELAAETPLAVIAAVTENYIRLDSYAAKLEVRANCE